MIHWDRYIAIIGRITQRPEVWEQGAWHCGTAHCVFGHAQIDSGNDACNRDVWDHAEKWLGLTDGEAKYISDPGRSLFQLQELAITQKFPWERP